jgi:hypothetical protein
MVGPPGFLQARWGAPRTHRTWREAAPQADGQRFASISSALVTRISSRQEVAREKPAGYQFAPSNRRAMVRLHGQGLI